MPEQKTLKDWFQHIEDRVKSADAEGKVFGACQLPNPSGGADICVQMDEQTCIILGGTFQGGPC